MMGMVLLRMSFLFLLGLGFGCGASSVASTGLPDGDVQYTVSFEATWSAATHPDSFPSSAHWSPLIGATHGSSVSFWSSGSVASAGIESMAETGSRSALSAEINTAIQAGTAQYLLLGPSLGTSPDSASFDIALTTSASYVTLVSMVAPSPDWFVGVSGLNLYENGEWVVSKSVDLYAYDAGTDSGTAYTSANQDTQPKETISQISVSPFLVNGTVVKAGQFTFTRK